MNNRTLPGSNGLLPDSARVRMVPWQTLSDWRQVELFFSLSCIDTPPLDVAEKHAAGIARRLASVDLLFEDFCRNTCSSCTDSCCTRATVWYDFCDLLFLYLSGKSLPAQQLVRRKGQSCPQLSVNGCCVERTRRPFICTWYICPEQTKMSQSLGESRYHELSTLLQEIKIERKAMERAFVNAVTA